MAALIFLLTSALAGSWRLSRMIQGLLVWAVVFVAAQLPSFSSTGHPAASLIEWSKTVFTVLLGFAMAGWVKPNWFPEA